jgi:putative ABC transport system permease protein
VLDRVLVVTQLALSLVLIAGAGLFVGTLQNLWSVDLGFDRENVLMFSLNPTFAGYPKERHGAFYREILQRLQSLPNVRSASASFVRPVDDQAYFVDVVEVVDGQKLPESDRIRVAYNVMTPGYFQTMGIPLLLGRDFDLRDNETAEKVVIVNESLARRALSGQNPIGHRLGAGMIVGVVKDVHYNGTRDKPRPVLYRPLFQADLGGDVTFEVRHQGGVLMLDHVRREVAEVDKNLPIFRIKTLRAQAADSLLRERLLAMLSSAFGGLALLLACLGLYGLMAYAVARRTSEIGIRMALGAGRSHVISMVLRETGWLVLAGITAGIPLALWTARYAKALLYEVTPADPLTMGAAAVVLMGVAAIAGYLPARRASRVDPMVALRYE